MIYDGVIVLSGRVWTLCFSGWPQVEAREERKGEKEEEEEEEEVPFFSF